MSERSRFVEVVGVTKRYEGGRVEALKGVNLSLSAGEVVAVMGPSGCGKSTLLALIGALDTPTGGRIAIGGEELGSVRALHRFRARTVGFVFQFHHLVPTLTLVENVESPMVALGCTKRERRAKALALLTEVGLSHRVHFLPPSVSGGERQRAAIARALANSPPLILADEPTGNLDSATGEAVVQLMLERSRRHGATVILATHNYEIAALADRIVTMRDGMLTDSTSIKAALERNRAVAGVQAAPRVALDSNRGYDRAVPEATESTDH